MADSSLFDIDSTLPDLNKLLRRRPAAYTASAAPVRKPGHRYSNPIEILDTPPPSRQAVPAAWRKLPPAPSTPAWLRRPRFTVVVENSVQASAQKSFPPLPPSGTPPPSRRQRRAASAASGHDTINPLEL